MRARLEVSVAELDCADEAQQIQGALRRLDGVVDVQTVVSTRRAVVDYDPERVRPGAILEAIRGLGVTVSESRAPAARRRSLPDLLGWVFVSVVAVAALVGVVGEGLGLVERLLDRIPAWVVLAAVLAGGYPIFRNVVRALRNRAVTSHALMTLGILGAIGIGSTRQRR